MIYLFLTSVNLLLPLLLLLLLSYLTFTFSGFPYKSAEAMLRMRRVRAHSPGGAAWSAAGALDIRVVGSRSAAACWSLMGPKKRVRVPSVVE